MDYFPTFNYIEGHRIVRYFGPKLVFTTSIHVIFLYRSSYSRDLLFWYCPTNDLDISNYLKSMDPIPLYMEIVN